MIENIYINFKKSNNQTQVQIWKKLNMNDQYIILQKLMIDSDEKSIKYLMGADYVTFEQHLFLIELNHDLKKEYEFIDHDTSIQLFKQRLLDFKFLSNFIHDVIIETEEILKINYFEHYIKLVHILLKIYEKYKNKFLARTDEKAFEQLKKLLIENVTIAEETEKLRKIFIEDILCNRLCDKKNSERLKELLEGYETE